MGKRKFVGFSMFSTKLSWRESCKGWKRGAFERELRLRWKGKEKRGGGGGAKVGLGKKRSGFL